MEENNIIELIDEEGNEVSFEHVATLEYKDKYYIVLMVAESEEPEEDEDDAGIVIMQITQDENGVDCYVPVQDDEEEAAVFEKFLTMMEEEEDL